MITQHDYILTSPPVANLPLPLLVLLLSTAGGCHWYHSLRACESWCSRSRRPLGPLGLPPLDPDILACVAFKSTLPYSKFPGWSEIFRR
jgi:hypothetical protein